MKKNLAILLIFIVSACLHAQEKISLCGQEYSYTFHQTPNTEMSATISWDFSKAAKGNGFILEVMPIKDCWNALSAERFKETFTFKIDGNEAKMNDSKILSFRSLNAKCFKWRFRSVSQDCGDASAWNYHSLVNAK